MAEVVPWYATKDSDDVADDGEETHHLVISHKNRNPWVARVTRGVCTH